MVAITHDVWDLSNDSFATSPFPDMSKVFDSWRFLDAHLSARDSSKFSLIFTLNVWLQVFWFDICDIRLYELHDHPSTKLHTRKSEGFICSSFSCRDTLVYSFRSNYGHLLAVAYEVQT